MERNVKSILTVLLLCLLFIACRGEIPSSDYMEGKWESEDGLTQIEFFSDGTCLGVLDSRMPDFEFFFKQKKEIRFDEGKWEFRLPNEYNTSYKLYLSIDEGYYTFDIKGSGLLCNKSPWTLFQFIGDPDQLEMYELHKVDKFSR